jgi:aminopeptidase N
MAAIGLAAAAVSAAAQDGRQALGRVVVPTRYQLTVTPDAASLTMSGDVRIDVELSAPTRVIEINAVELALDDVTLDGGNVPAVELDSAAQTARLTFPEPLATGRHSLAIVYRAKIYRTAQALFAYDYTSEHGPERVLATQFEIAEARRFVPSFDQPDLKAVWEITVVVPESRAAVSNMPPVATEPAGEGLKRVRFAPTPKMSSYLLFLGIGDLERATAKAGDVEIGVVTKRGDLERARFALDSAVELLRWFDDYFGVPYPLPKLDLVAVPGSAGFGAMENWGAILYFESTMLLDPDFSSEADRQRVFTVVAHEMAHQWFGNLVTPAWWDDLWLNEGFAAWMERKSTDELHPDWSIWTRGQHATQQAMGLDGRKTAHPVVQDIRSVDEANAAFDRITYEKGRAVIRMIEEHVGAERFRAGVRAYVRAHAYGNARTVELWDAIEAAAGKPMRGIAEDFTFRSGVPLIEVQSAACERDRRTVSLKQGRFALDDESRAPLVWHVPVTVADLGGREGAALTGDDGSASVELRGCGTFVVNPSQTGYYRTLYARPVFDELARSFARLAPADQLGLLYDSSALGIVGLVPFSDKIDLARRAPRDADALVIEWVAAELAQTDRLYADLPGREAFRTFARALLGPAFARLGWERRSAEPANDAIARERVIAALSQLGDPAIDAEARRRFERGEIAGAVREETLYAVGRAADRKTFAALLDQARASTATLDQAFLFRALAHARDPALAALALEAALDERTPLSLGPPMIGDVAAEHPRLAWDFALAHRGAVSARLDPLGAMTFVAELAGEGNDESLLRDLRSYIDREVPEDVRRPSESQYLRLAERLMIRAERLPELDAWLRARPR